MATPEYDLESISPMGWRLLRVAAGFSQRDVEREVDELMQAHLSMLESGSRGLSASRRQVLFELYTAELEPAQYRALIDNF